MAGLLFGVETEYAVAGMGPGGNIDRERFVHRLMALARTHLVQLPDMFSSGGIFMQNGSRFMIDHGMHPEISTAECSDPRQVLRYLQAGHRILASLAARIQAESPAGTEIMCFRTNVCHGGGLSTFGAHESYSHRRPPGALQSQIIPHLCTRPVFIGAGGFNPLSHGLEFTLSPRVAHLREVVSPSSTHDRPIFHMKNEPLGSGYNRLHVLCGELECSELATWLKVGTTALVVALADAALAPGNAVQLDDPLAAMRAIAVDPSCRVPLVMSDGSLKAAIEIQRHYQRMAVQHLGADFMPSWSGEVCQAWGSILDRLEAGPDAVDRSLDWAIKRKLYARHAHGLGIRWEKLPVLNRVIERALEMLGPVNELNAFAQFEEVLASRRRRSATFKPLEPLLDEHGVSWSDVEKVLASRPAFFEIDTRFGQLDSPKGIFDALDRDGLLDHRIDSVEAGERAIALSMIEPPQDNRARIRGEVIRRLAGEEMVVADWQRIVNHDTNMLLDLSNPYTSEETWRPLHGDELRAPGIPDYIFESRQRSSDRVPGPDERRHNALQCYLRGDFAGAEVLLRALLEEMFEVPSTHCHLVRVLLMMDREEEARNHAAQAWATRHNGPRYVAARALFLRILFAVFNGAPITGMVSELCVTARERGIQMDWTIQPMLDRLRARLGEQNHARFSLLAAALSDSSGVAGLDALSGWGETEPAASTAAHAGR